LLTASAGNKYLRREATRDSRAPGAADEEASEARSECPAGVSLRWSAEVASSVYATPLVADLFGDGGRQVVVSTFVQALESLEGADGSKTPGFPSAHGSTAHASPFLFDADGDGALDVGVALYDGEVVFHSADGVLLPQRLRIPALAVPRDWHVGLAPDPLDRSQLDVGDGPQPPAGPARRLLQAANASEADGGGGWASDATLAAGAAEAESEESGAAFDANSHAPETLLGHEGAYEGGRAGGRDYRGDYRGRGGGPPHDPDDYYAGWATEAGWAGRGAGAEEEAGADAVLIDPHILCSPTLADLDGDGRLELLVSVSYYFDKEVYAEEEARKRLPANISLGDYHATGLVVFDLSSLRLLWKVHLDLSTDAASFRAVTYSSPAAADVDADGRLEVFLGTSVGFVYSFSAEGALRAGYPLQLGEVQAYPGLADLDGDGALELLVADTRGNVACFDAQRGVEKWERHLGSSAAQGPTFADVDGDGALDVILGTHDGRVHALRGADGADCAGFPFVTRGRVLAPVLALGAHPDGAGAGRRPRLTLVAASFDGFLYFVDAQRGCADAVDIGETMYGQPLAEDVDGDGRLELIVTTMNGNVLCLATPWAHHALLAWPAQAPDGNPAARAGVAGVAVGPASRALRDVSTADFPVQFAVSEERAGAAAAAALAALRRPGSGAAPGEYVVTTTLRVAGRAPVSRALRVAGAGSYALRLPAPPQRSRGVVRVEMVDPYGLRYADTFSLSFHMRYARLLKWLLVLPFTFVALALGGGWLVEEGRPADRGRAGLLGAEPRRDD